VRDRRIALQTTAAVAASFAVAVALPAWAFVLGPVVFGVAHLASDVRYLLVRPAAPAWWKRAAVLACVALVALRGMELAGVRAVRSGETEIVLGASLLAAAALAGGSRARAGLGVAAALALAAAGLARPGAVRLALAHAHNPLAIVLWLAVFRRGASQRARSAWLPAALAGAAALVLFSGATVCVAARTGGLEALGVHLFDVATFLAPGLPADLDVGAVLAFTFLQSVHYAIWLSLIPQETTRGAGTLSFRMTARGLVRDLRPAGIAATALLGLALLAGAAVDAPRARQAYLSLAAFHGWLELWALALFLGGTRSALRTDRICAGGGGP
jgi:hypothetical protein